MTMRWKGVDVADARVNYYSSEQTPAGLTVTIAAGVTGAGNPDSAALARTNFRRSPSGENTAGNTRT